MIKKGKKKSDYAFLCGICFGMLSMVNNIKSQVYYFACFCWLSMGERKVQDNNDEW